MPSPTLCLMLKAPRAGLVKTRLARDIGDAAALAAYRCLVERQVSAIPGDWHLEVHFTPDDGAGEMRRWLQPLRRGTIDFFPQIAGDLGARLTAALRGAFERGAHGVLFAGGDCPALDSHALGAAASGLLRSDVVLIPALDGGYVLIGLRRCMPGVFDNIQWSTASVLRETLERIGALGITSELLEPLEDVDDLESWERAKRLL